MHPISEQEMLRHSFIVVNFIKWFILSYIIGHGLQFNLLSYGLNHEMKSNYSKTFMSAPGSVLGNNNKRMVCHVKVTNKFGYNIFFNL